MSEQYNEESIKSLDWKEHIRLRPGMYIGKLGDGHSYDDGVYILLKEVIDNSIDEFVMGNGRYIDVSVNDKTITVRDYGRGIPLGSIIDCVSKINTGAKYDSKVFKKSVGLNGVGTKAVNALSSYFKVQSVRDKKTRTVEFNTGVVTSDITGETNSKNGTKISFIPDEEIFGKYIYIEEHIERLLWNYVFLNAGLTINYNGNKIYSENGLKDLLERNINDDIVYPIIHLKGEDIELALTHSKNKYGEEYYSFVNGQYTPQGGTHQLALRECLVKTIREYYNKNLEPSDIRTSIIAAFSIKVTEPVFESQTKTKLGSQYVEPDGVTIKAFVNDFIKKQLDNFLHKNPETADLLLSKIVETENERKALSNIKKVAKEKAKKANVHNKKLRDCRIHFYSKDERSKESSIFITEGDSASGSITKARDVNTQAVFSLKGKPLNTLGLSKKVIYENEEFNLLYHALNIENGIDELKYNNIIISTDADVDGMHIRLLLLTFFLQFFPELIKAGHLYILQTPLFRIRNTKKTYYCYNEDERVKAINELGKKAEITRFKGLGEISPDEFKNFIGKSIRLEPVMFKRTDSIHEMLNFYMGKNTPERQKFIIDNLKLEEAVVE